LLEAHFETACNALRWCDELGDRDGDGLQEYQSRSRKGYRNQGWKDAGDAVVDATGRQPPLPIATIELQGYLFAARLAMAELEDESGRRDDAQRRREQAATLRDAVEKRLWLEHERFYAFGVDGNKRSIDAIASNAGHLLWSGLPRASRAEHVAKRLLDDDMFSGWGLRTLSARNPAYNALSYQLGSVWPHDTLIGAAGLWRYGLREQAAALIEAVLRAAEAFDEYRLPELFCGLDASCGFPVPYEATSCSTTASSGRAVSTRSPRSAGAKYAFAATRTKPSPIQSLKRGRWRSNARRFSRGHSSGGAPICTRSQCATRTRCPTSPPARRGS
jgi:glycogen debranching enzyme